MAHFGAAMRKNRRSVSSQIGVSQETISKKIRKVHDEHPELSHDAVVGRAIGTLKHRKKKGRKLL